MEKHKALQVIDAVVELLTSGLAVPVIRNRLQPAQQLPSVAVRMGGDSPNQTQHASEDRTIEIFIDMLVGDSTAADLDAQTLALRLDIERLLRPHNALGLPFVIDIGAPEIANPDYEGDGELPIGATRTRWPITYRINPTNPI